MSENVYDDVVYNDQPQSGQKMEMAGNIVVNAAAVRSHHANTEMENCNTTTNLLKL